MCGDNPRMLQRLRQRRSLHAVVFTVFALAWLAALAAGVQTRVALAQLQPADVCSVQDAHALHGPDGSADAPAGYAHHHAPDCLLCIGLATPPAPALAAWRSPVPLAHQDRRSPTRATLAWRAQAPLPARGPPALFHA